MAKTVDLGTVLSLLGTGITTSYQASAAFNGGLADKTRVTGKLVTTAGSAATGMVLKISVSDDGVTYYDIDSDNDVTRAAAIDQTFAAGAAPATIEASVSFDGTYKFFKASAKATGGTGQAGDSLLLTGIDILDP